MMNEADRFMETNKVWTSANDNGNR